METIELRQAARRAYELGRVRFGAKLAAAALVVGAAAVGLGRPVGISVALSIALGALVGLFAFRGGAAGRAVWPALAAGTAAMFFPLAIRTAGCSLFGPQCMRFCLHACVAGGVAMGAAAQTDLKTSLAFAFPGLAIFLAIVLHKPADGNAAISPNREQAARDGHGPSPATRPEGKSEPPDGQPFMVIDKNVSLSQLGPLTQHPLLRIRFRWQDQPGAFLNVVPAIGGGVVERYRPLRMFAR